MALPLLVRTHWAIDNPMSSERRIFVTRQDFDRLTRLLEIYESGRDADAYVGSGRRAPTALRSWTGPRFLPMS